MILYSGWCLYDHQNGGGRAMNLLALHHTQAELPALWCAIISSMWLIAF